MPKQKVRRTIIREWMSLPATMRQSAQQATQFARKATEQHTLPRRRLSPFVIVMRWLRPRTGRA
jgi:hypothetical protein